MRVSISTKEEFEEKWVKIGVLVTGEQEGYQHGRHVRTANYIFSRSDQILNFDDLLSFDELNDIKLRSPYLSGVSQETLKILVTITPLHRSGSLAIP